MGQSSLEISKLVLPRWWQELELLVYLHRSGELTMYARPVSVDHPQVFLPQGLHPKAVEFLGEGCRVLPEYLPMDIFLRRNAK